MDEEGFSCERSKEGPQSPGEVQGVHVGATVTILPQPEDNHIDRAVQGPVTNAREEGADVERDQRGAEGKHRQGNTQQDQSSCNFQVLIYIRLSKSYPRESDI